MFYIIRSTAQKYLYTFFGWQIVDSLTFSAITQRINGVTDDHM